MSPTARRRSKSSKPWARPCRILLIIALFAAAGGEVLSKREGSLSLRTLRADGIEAMALNAYLARIGTSDAIEPALSFRELAEGFAFEKMGRALAHFEMHELLALNAKTLHAMPYEAVAPRLGVSEALWDAVKPNVVRLSDVAALSLMVTGPVQPVIEDAGLLAKALTLLPPEPWDESTWGTWTKALAAETGTKGRALFHPLRLALTGQASGPELKKLLPLIGRAKASARLEGTDRVNARDYHSPDQHLQLTLQKSFFSPPQFANFINTAR